MARTTVPVEPVDRYAVTSYNTGTVVAGNTVDGMRMPNDGATLLYIDNNSGLDQTVDFLIPETLDFQPVSPSTVTVPASSTVNLIGPFPTKFYGNVLEFDVSSASMDFAAFSLL